MSTTVGTNDVKTHLSEYLNRVAYRGERVVVERHGKPVAALVSVEDLRKLEALDTRSLDNATDEVREAKFLELARQAGLIIHQPTGKPISRGERKLIEFEGEPISEQLIRERR
jgi:prevent-host-death family protein